MNSVNRPAKKKTRIGILGAGGVVKDFHLPVLRNMPELEVSWLCDKVESQARRLSRSHVPPFRVFTRIEDCPDVDIVLLAIPVGFRHDPLQHIFKRGWNVLCEKPFAVSLSECDALLKQASESGVQIGVGLMRRYYRANLLAARLIQSGAFGQIQEVWASQGARLMKTGREEWYQGDQTAAGGGILMETGSHLVDQVFTVLNVSHFELRDCRQRMINGLDLETRAIASLTTPTQCEIKFTVALSNARDLYSGIDIRFSTAILKLSVSSNSPELWSLGGQPLAHLEGEDGAQGTYQSFCLEWRDFVRQCVSPDMYKAAISAETARQSIAFIDECYQMTSLLNMPVTTEGVETQ